MEPNTFPESSKDNIQDLGLIEKQVKKDIKRFSSENDLSIEKVIEKASMKGMAHFITTKNEIPKTKPEDLVDDNFHYQPWQINVLHHLNGQEKDIEISEIKTAFLTEGLKQMKSSKEQ